MVQIAESTPSIVGTDLSQGAHRLPPDGEILGEQLPRASSDLTCIIADDPYRLSNPGPTVEKRSRWTADHDSDSAKHGYTPSLIRIIRRLRERLDEIESSRWWRLRAKYQRLRAILRRRAASVRGLSWFSKLMVPFSARGRKIVRRTLKVVFRSLYLLLEENEVAIVSRNHSGTVPSPYDCQTDSYSQWRARNMPRAIELLDYREQLKYLPYQPTISILLPVYNPPLAFFERALQSVLDQVYPNWELCIADDASTDPGVREAIAHLANHDPRIKVVYRSKNGHISAATNSALSLATGDFCAFLDHDDLLTPDALYQNVLALNRDKTLDLIYSDEDKVDEKGKEFEPHFKPQWCPDSLLARNYLCHLLVVRTALLHALGGQREGFEGAQDYDMVLRATERSQRIQHIPRVLYHWRSHAQSTARSLESKPYVHQAAIKALGQALQRRAQPGTVDVLESGHYSIRYAIVRPGKVSILIPTRDQSAVLENCLHSIFTRTAYADFEVIVVDNNSMEQSTFELFERYRDLHAGRFQVLKLPILFNFSRLLNAAAAWAAGEYFLLLNNDTEVMAEEWLGAMVEQAQRPTIGCVGVKLLYPDRTIQHAGVVLCRTGACHAFAGADQNAPGYFNWIQTVNNYSAVTAACLMVRQGVYHQVGGFDEAYAVEYNDVDFCLRVREAGYDNVYLPHVSLFHHESLTRGHPLRNAESSQRHARETALLRQYWSQYQDSDPCLSPHLTLGEQDLQVRL